MTKVSFYCQARADGGMRTGISVNDENVFGRFDEGSATSQPYLRWFVDVRCEGRLPADPGEARRWLIEHGAAIKEGLVSMANRVRAGIDVDAIPVAAPVAGMPKGVKATIVCAASTIESAREISKALRGTARRWRALLSRLQTLQAA